MKASYHLESIQNSQYWKRNMHSQCVIGPFQIGETYFEHFAFFLIALWKFSFSEKITIAHFKTFHDSYRKFVAKISLLRNIQFQTNLYLPLQFKLTLHFKNTISLTTVARHDVVQLRSVDIAGIQHFDLLFLINNLSLSDITYSTCPALISTEKENKPARGSVT